MDNSKKFLSSKYAVIFEGKDYKDDTKTYSIMLDVDCEEYMPVWGVDSYKAIPLFFHKVIAENFVHTLKTSTKAHITNFLNTYEININSLRILKLGYTNECNFEEVLLNI